VLRRVTRSPGVLLPKKSGSRIRCVAIPVAKVLALGVNWWRGSTLAWLWRMSEAQNKTRCTATGWRRLTRPVVAEGRGLEPPTGFPAPDFESGREISQLVILLGFRATAVRRLPSGLPSQLALVVTILTRNGDGTCSATDGAVRKGGSRPFSRMEAGCNSHVESLCALALPFDSL
jgi:hypothetical protein